MSAPSSTSQAKSEPPSAQRAAEARAEGHAPRAELAGLAAAWLVFALSFSQIVTRIGGALQTSLRTSLQGTTQGQAIAVHDVASSLFRSLGLFIACTLAACFAAIVITRAIAQAGFVFSMRALFPSKRYDKVKSARGTIALLTSLITCVVIAASLPDALRAERAQLSSVLSLLTLRLSAGLLVLALIDASLARAQWWRSLWMTRRERLAEEREAYGSPELRKARERIRQELHAQPLSRPQERS